MLRVVSSGPRIEANLRRFVQRKLKGGPRLSFQAAIEALPTDVLVAVDNNRILGACNHLRIAPGTSAIANMRFATSAAGARASPELLKSATNRTSQVGNRFVSCIPGSDREPSDGVLNDVGFERQMVRTIFNGRVEGNEPGSVNQTLDMNRVLEILKEMAGHTYLTLHFRPAPLSLATLEYATSHGALFVQAEPERGGVLVFESPCIETDAEPYAIPYSLLRIAKPGHMGVFGEISVMGGVGLRPAILSGLRWLQAKGITKATVYASEDRDLGVLLMQLGFNPVRSQVIWTKTITGPIDFYLGA